MPELADPYGFFARAAALEATYKDDPERQARGEFYDRQKRERDEREKALARQKRQDDSQAARRRRAEKKRRDFALAMAEGKVMIRSDPGPPPGREWFYEYISYRVPGLRFTHAQSMGMGALRLAVERLPKGHPNPPAFVLRYAKNVMAGKIYHFVTPDAAKGMEHLVVVDPRDVEYGDEDDAAGESEQMPRSNIAEYAKTARQHRPGPLLPVGHIPNVKRETNHFPFDKWREPGED